MSIQQTLRIVLLLIAATPGRTRGLSALTTTISVTVINIVYASWMEKVPFYCRVWECCDDQWIKLESLNLKNDLTERVYGQPSVRDIVPLALQAHLKYPPQKALVLSFQGPTGTGKTLVAKIIAKNLYKQGMKSKYVHLLHGINDFGRPELAGQYKDQIRDWVRGNVNQCMLQLFIFDEVDKMPEGVLDVLSPFLNHYETMQGVDYRKSIFLFLSNFGAKALRDELYNHYYLEGKDRSEFKLNDAEQSLMKSALQEPGGLKDSALISSSAISHYVPFLPLEKHHVRRCIEDNLEWHYNGISQRNREIIINGVMSQILFDRIYSSNGCKQVFAKTNLALEEFYADRDEL